LIFSNLQEIEEKNKRRHVKFEDNEEQRILDEKRIASQTEPNFSNAVTSICKGNCNIKRGNMGLR